ncbi:MAG TPA: riboflavin synthase [Candidatus Saccharimonadales bacterium]|nr:riboflavin synthase [Candidatus Saccharimonadales bacterium]
MFTGIIKDLGKLEKKDNALFVFEAENEFCKKLEKGTSISVNGACLTVIEKPESNTFSVEIMPETASKTILGSLQKEDIVNLELPVTMSEVLSGHIVQGHIDSTGEILKIENDGNSRIFMIALSQSLKNQVVEKGSITINGISLTVISVNADSFTVGVIPFTWKNTMLYTAKLGDMVNIETDILGKYVEKNLNKL